MYFKQNENYDIKVSLNLRLYLEHILLHTQAVKQKVNYTEPIESRKTDSHVLRANNAIWFVKERLRSIQCETPFKKFPKRFIIEMVKRVTVRINLFRSKSGVHPVISTRQMLLGKKFKTPLCKIGKLVMAYDVTANNKTKHPRAFYALYIGPNDSGTGHIVFKLLTKRLVITPKRKPSIWLKT